MKSNKWLLGIGILALLASCSGSDDNEDTSKPTPVSNANGNIVTGSLPSTITDLEFPKVKGGNSVVVSHFDNGELNYSIEWDNIKKANRWSCYKMYATNRVQNTSRYYVAGNDRYSLQYPTDPEVSTSWIAGYNTDPFWGSNYDHGHLCPSADRLQSANANYQTFYLTNMTPQNGDFNQTGAWAGMEIKLRSWITASSSSSDTLYVCKGGTIDNADQIYTTTAKGLIVPKYNFCVCLMKNNYGYKAIGFWFNQFEDKTRSTNYNLADYVVNIDYIEQQTGIDFFCNLPDKTEDHVESLSVENIKRAWSISK